MAVKDPHLKHKLSLGSRMKHNIKINKRKKNVTRKLKNMVVKDPHLGARNTQNACFEQSQDVYRNH